MWWMIDDFLAYSRIGKSGNYEKVDINNIISGIETDFGKIIEDSNATIKANNLPAISCRVSEIKQLVQNLIANAIKFKRPEVSPIVEITREEPNNHLQFCVADNGIGISKEKHKEIFQMFNSLNSPEKYEGHGIGLAFCKKIVESHNGKIWVESSLGYGSNFYFTIQKNQFSNIIYCCSLL